MFEGELNNHPIPFPLKPQRRIRLPIRRITRDAVVIGLTTHGAAVIQDLHRAQIIVIIAFLDVIINIIKTETPGVSGIG